MNIIKLPVELKDIIPVGVGAIFLIILLISFLCLLILFAIQNKRTEHQLNLIRIIGGISILLFSLASGNAYIQFASIFIGGLLIASENFLVHLAAIFKSASEKVPDVMQSYRHLSPEEVTLKQTQEISETALVDEVDELGSMGLGGDKLKSSKLGKNTLDSGVGIVTKKDVGNDYEQIAESSSQIVDRKSESVEDFFKASMARYNLVTELVLGLVERSIIGHHEMLRRLVSLQVDNATLKLDGVVVERNTNRIVSAIEVKFFKKLNVEVIKSVLSKYAQSFNDVDYNLVFILATEEYDYGKINQLFEFRNKMKQINSKIGLMIYQVHTSSMGEALDMINDEDKLLLSDNIILRF